MAVTFDAAANAKSNAGATSLAPVLVVGTGANQAALILLEFLNSPTQVSGISVSGGGGSAWTVVGGTDTGATTSPRTLIYKATGLASGSQTITASWTGTSEAGCVAVSAFGVNQAAPAINGTNITQSVSNTSPLTLTSVVGDLGVDIAANNDGTYAIASGTQTVIINGGTNLGNFGVSRAAGAASITFNWTGGGGGTPAWAHSAADLSAAVIAEEDFTGTGPIWVLQNW